MSKSTVELNITKHCTPIIDKIALTVPRPNLVLKSSILNGGKIDHDKDFSEAIYTAVNDKTLFSNGKWQRYKFSKVMNLVNSPHRINAQFFPLDADNNAFGRFEFNPWKLGELGLNEFASNCESLFYDAYEYVQEHAKVTRVDVAIDLHGVEVEDVQMAMAHKAISQKYSFDGETQTIYAGSSKGQQFKAYNKLAQLKLKHEVPVTRLEYKLTPQIPLHKLHTLPNPFKNVQIGNPPAKAPIGVEKWLWRVIRDSITQRGTTAALNGLPPELRQQVRETLKKHSAKWWNSDDVWKQWPQAVMPVFSGGMIVPDGTCCKSQAGPWLPNPYLDTGAEPQPPTQVS